MKQFQPKIEKAVIAALPIVQPFGDIVVIKTAHEADWAVAQLMKEPLIGFDTETRPNFTPYSHYTISLLQLATPTTCYLFRLQYIGQHEGLKKLLETTDVKKIGLSVHDDFHALQAWMPLKPQNFVELQTFVTPYGIEEKSLQKIYAIIFKQKISKSQQLSNWELPLLTPQQKSYAAIDAWACLHIYNELTK